MIASVADEGAFPGCHLICDYGTLILSLSSFPSLNAQEDRISGELYFLSSWISMQEVLHWDQLPMKSRRCLKCKTEPEFKIENKQQQFHIQKVKFKDAIEFPPLSSLNPRPPPLLHNSLYRKNLITRPLPFVQRLENNSVRRRGRRKLISLLLDVRNIKNILLLLLYPPPNRYSILSLCLAAVNWIFIGHCLRLSCAATYM